MAEGLGKVEAHRGASPEKPTRLLLVLKDVGLGGAELIVLNFAKFFSARDVDIHCAHVRRTDEDFVERLEALGVQCHHLGASPMGGWLWPYRLGRLLTSGFDVVHSHAPLPGSFARLLARVGLRRRPLLVTTEHLPWFGYRRSTRLLNRLTVRYDDLVISVSPATTASMPEGIRSRARTVVHGIDLDHYAACVPKGVAEPSEGNSDDVVLYGAIGNFQAQKNYPGLLDAFSIVVEEIPAARLAVAGLGTDGPEMAELVAKRGLEHQVSVVGACDNVPHFLRSLDVFVHAASYEAGPLVVMEALAAGVPVVSSRVGILATHLEGGKEVLISEPDDSLGLARNMIAAGIDPDLRLRLAESGFATRHRFSAARASKEVEAMIWRSLAAHYPRRIS